MHLYLARIGSSLALGFVAGVAHAAPCYTLFDRYDNVIYRSTLPPVDMSRAGAAARDGLRARGEYLMFADMQSCPPVVFRFGEAGNKNLSIDQVVGGFTPASSSPVPAGESAPARTGR